MTLEFVSEHESLVISIMLLMTEAYQAIYLIAKQANFILLRLIKILFKFFKYN